jgi:hypothetical protein
MGRYGPNRGEGMTGLPRGAARSTPEHQPMRHTALAEHPPTGKNTQLSALRGRQERDEKRSDHLVDSPKLLQEYLGFFPGRPVQSRQYTAMRLPGNPDSEGIATNAGISGSGNDAAVHLDGSFGSARWQSVPLGESPCQIPVAAQWVVKPRRRCEAPQKRRRRGGPPARGGGLGSHFCVARVLSACSASFAAENPA